MKYVVIYIIGEYETARCFSTKDAAIEYINSCTSILDNRLDEFVELDEDEYHGVLVDGTKMRVSIVVYSQDRIRYDLIRYMHGRRREKRRFTKRYLAIEYAEKQLVKIGYQSDRGEVELGRWTVGDYKKDLDIHYVLKLVVGSQTMIMSEYYNVLGVDANSTIDEIKTAYRCKCKEHHPDVGGSELEFKKVQEAYDFLINNYNTQRTFEVENTFESIDLRYVFAMFDNIESIDRF